MEQPKPPMYRSQHDPSVRGSPTSCGRRHRHRRRRLSPSLHSTVTRRTQAPVTGSTFGTHGTTQLHGAGIVKKRGAATFGPSNKTNPNPQTYLKRGAPLELPAPSASPPPPALAPGSPCRHAPLNLPTLTTCTDPARLATLAGCTNDNSWAPSLPPPPSPFSSAAAAAAFAASPHEPPQATTQATATVPTAAASNASPQAHSHQSSTLRIALTVLPHHQPSSPSPRSRVQVP